MTTCGIKKYDDLPARVGLYDVDFLRYIYKRHISPDWTCLPVIHTRDTSVQIGHVYL